MPYYLTIQMAVNNTNGC